MSSLPASGQSTLPGAPVELLQRLLRFDTTNPPGNEAACMVYLEELLAGAGWETTLLARTPERPNLVARLRGQGQAPPLLLYGHADVVTTANQSWQQPPFAGNLVDGYVWGRGALDMKGGLAMMLAALLRAQGQELPLPGDVLLAVVSDEEAGGAYGARYLVENHPGLFEGVRYAISEFGGFTFYVVGRRFYPIMVAEKQACWLRAIVRGPGGHGSLDRRAGAMAQLADLLKRLERHQLPVHVTDPARLTFQTMGRALPFPTGWLLRQLLNPLLTDSVLRLLGQQGKAFAPLFHHTVNATRVRGGEAINVTPSEIVLDLDGRLLPGFGPDSLMAELGRIIGGQVELQLVAHEPGPAEPDLGLFDTLAGILRSVDPAGTPVPMLLPGTTDARFFSRLGIQTYGFIPMRLPCGFNFAETIHGPDERIPVEALAFGTEAIYQLLQQFGSATR